MKPLTVKAMSLHQPWASLIAAGVKNVETRSRPPPQSLIGQRIAIHAAKKVVAFPDAPAYREFNDAVNNPLGHDWLRTAPKGGDELLFGDFTLGSR